jgi:hypothetical protein
MSKEWETYVRLQRYSNELRKNGKSIWNENLEGARKLNRFGIIIEENLVWKERNHFVILFQEFIYGTLTADDFSNIFGVKYLYRTRQKVNQLEIDLEKNDYKSGELLELIIVGEDYKDYIRRYSDILGQAEALTEDFRVDPEVGSDEIGEEELRNFVEKALFEIQEIVNDLKK